IIATVTDEGCAFSDTLIVSVLASPTAGFSISQDTICQSELIEVTFDGLVSSTANYDWDFGGASILSGTSAGPYELFVTDPGTFYIQLSVSDYGCSSPVAIDSFYAQPLLDAVVISCDNSALNQVTFSWDPITGADSFLITINSTSGPQIFQDSLTYTVGGLMEGDEVVIFVTPLGEGACSPITSTSCTATSCPDLTVTLPDQPVPFCIDQDPVMLSGTVDNGNNGTVIWSGPGVTNDVFDPIDAGVGLHTIMFNYEEPGPCILIDSFQIEVFPLPENDFMLNASEICVNEEVVLTYTGSAGPGAQYLWGIGGASMISQPDPNEEEYELVYDSPGTYFVTLIVTENGCFSPQAIDSIVVFEPLGQVVLNCGINGLNETTVEWTYGGTATLFEVVVGGVIVDTITGNSYTQTGLMPGEIVDFTITPITLTDPCGDGDPASISCSAAPCPDLSIDLPATPFQLCVDDDPLALNETIINGSGGTVTWSGTGVMSNEFDPADAGVGLFTLIVDYSEAGPCTLQDSFQVEVLPLPASDFDFDPT
ncbi:MAG: hypothetical protein AAFQ01_02525, partial [Bacteroidota bacterium]